MKITVYMFQYFSCLPDPFHTDKKFIILHWIGHLFNNFLKPSLHIKLCKLDQIHRAGTCTSLISAPKQ